MKEQNLDFNTYVDRFNTNSLKYDFATERGKPEGILPLWVADMDFKTSSFVRDAVCHQAEHGIWGYSDSKETYFNAVKNWMETRHQWQVKEEWLVKTPGVVFALAMAVQAYTKEGDSVLIQTPVYYPFRNVIEKNNRVVVDSPLVETRDGSYVMDFADVEEKIRSCQVKMVLLCSPHNPVGRVWRKEELKQLGDLCKKYGVIVVSDEIHGDFVHQGKHHVFSSVDPSFEAFSVICTAPSKTFNIAGLQVSNIFIPNPVLRERFAQKIDASGYSQLNTAGLVACEAAYTKGEEWYQAMLSYVQENIDYTYRFILERLPMLSMKKPEGTYLVWVDCRKLQLSVEELEDLMVNKAGLWLDGGTMFGEKGAGFQRVNVACPRSTLRTALERLERALTDK